MVMYDGDPSRSLQLAQDYGLSFPILTDTSLSVFSRFDPSGDTPSSTFIAEGMVVHSVDVAWYPALIEEILYGEDQ